MSDSEEPSTANKYTNSFLPIPQALSSEEDSIRESSSGTDPLEWPQIGQHELNKFSIEEYKSV